MRDTDLPRVHPVTVDIVDVDDASTRTRIAAGWAFEVDDDYVGRRGADDWPPRYTSWRAG